MKKFLIISLLFAGIETNAQNLYTDSLKKQIAHVKEDTVKVNLLCQLSYSYIWSFADTSIIYARQALQLARKINYEKGIGLSEGDMSLAFTTLGNYPQGLDYGFQELSLYKKLNDLQYVAYAYSDIGMCYRDQGSYTLSIAYFLDAAKLIQKFHPDSYDLQGLWIMIGSVYAKKNQTDSALFYANKGYDDKKLSSGRAFVFGSIYEQKGNYKAALQFFRRTALLADKAKYRIDKVDAYNGISGVYLKEGQVDSAIYYAEKAIALKWGKAYPIGMLGSYTMLTDIYEKKRITDSTLKYLKLTFRLKDSLFSQQKEREVQNIAFNDELKQQGLLKQQEEAKNRIRYYVLIAVLIGSLLIAVLQRRNNRQKQKAYNILRKQKQETDFQRAKAEQTLGELRATQGQLIQSEKMASMGMLTAGIAHEIQNPLNFVNNFSQVNGEMIDELETELRSGNIDEALAITADIKQNEEKISHHGKRAESIVKGMLEHSRNSTGEKQLTNINKLCDEFIKLSYHGLRAKDENFNAEMISDFDPNAPLINIIPQDIGRVLLNLFNNAFYAVNQKKKTAGAGYIPGVSVTTSTENGQVIIKIKDNGIGIPDAIKDKIMQPFFTTKPTGEGTGLGLSLTYDMVVKGHGGKLQIDSKEGEYSVFTVSLPLS
ncbi:MAG TPA: tetratricopeptide repeat-containing sensor histidine kinase [Mucilaginibacter sp.]|jgi:signal transduction histidine kinase|nr:tetratricopeptide repeat-containing sensor histidine kinase [Mucilaginibacter sp.]